MKLVGKLITAVAAIVLLPACVVTPKKENRSGIVKLAQWKSSSKTLPKDSEYQKLKKEVNQLIDPTFTTELDMLVTEGFWGLPPFWGIGPRWDAREEQILPEELKKRVDAYCNSKSVAGFMDGGSGTLAIALAVHKELDKIGKKARKDSAEEVKKIIKQYEW
jgi:hypothetical protein